ncbi:MAG: DUF1015 family protein [Candidatus Methanomethylophilaceae archaeon]|nr:DUF1015 family protein [Candidatus Methanomethylophilaceae archaeon]
MTTLRPFPGVRPASPLDVRKLLVPGPDKRFAQAGRIMASMLSDGSLARDEDSFYVYEQRLPDGRSRLGTIGVLETAGIRTLGTPAPKAKGESLAAIEDTGFQLEPVVCLSRDLVIPDGEQVMESAGPDGTVHRLLKAPAGTDIEMGEVLAVDGIQHLASDEAMAVVFRSDDSWIAPVHRTVDTGSISEKNAFKALSKAMSLTEAALAEIREGSGRFGFVFKSGACYAAECGSEKPDARLIQDAVLDGIYKSDEGKGRVSYYADMDAVLADMAEKKHDLAVIMRTPDLDALWDASPKVPKNPAAFPPAVLSGMVIRPVRPSE